MRNCLGKAGSMADCGGAGLQEHRKLKVRDFPILRLLGSPDADLFCNG